ncbi:uncharacterized protein JN550_008798 [Neoarthrinium moseri]|uniref:uncharacterized protein n=1 Tax=Neoarthrinium moseri TaxID=1658444 RepID=UPI001FDD607C|nr:uncharacterized protein JN550_008798 [Neoarthrinium moseri]KAI1864511.1 hypothetical protein JN550_008798 [Neoarthrinium moseri]
MASNVVKSCQASEESQANSLDRTARILEHVKRSESSMKQFRSLDEAFWKQVESSYSSSCDVALSPTELDFITRLKESGGIDKLIELAENSSAITGSEQTEAATADLNNWVDNLAKMSANLESNLKQSLVTVQSSRSSNDRRADLQKAKKTSLEEAKARIEAMVEHEESNIKSRGENIQSGLAKLISGHNELLNDQAFDMKSLSSDLVFANEPYDNLLGKLQALGWEMKADPQTDSLVKAARYYSSLEVFLSVSACRRQLNSALKEASNTYSIVNPVGTGKARALEAEIQAIFEEIRSLWDEVVPVAHMAVEKTLLEPILKTAGGKKTTREYQNAIIGSYIGGCLDFMNERLQALANRVGVAVYHHNALLTAFEHYLALPQDRPAEVVTRGHSQAHHLQPIGGSRGQAEATTALKYIQKGVDTFGGFPFKAIDPLTPASQKITKLTEFVQQRAAKGSDSEQVLHRLYESAVKVGLATASESNLLILDHLLADSLAGQGRAGSVLEDAQAEESLSALRNESQEINSLFQKLNLTGAEAITDDMRPLFRGHMKSFEDHRQGQTAGHFSKSDAFHAKGKRASSCELLQRNAKVVEIIQRWSELPEFKRISR